MRQLSPVGPGTQSGVYQGIRNSQRSQVGRNPQRPLASFGVVGNIMLSVPGVIECALLGELDTRPRTTYLAKWNDAPDSEDDPT